MSVAINGNSTEAYLRLLISNFIQFNGMATFPLVCVIVVVALYRFIFAGLTDAIGPSFSLRHSHEKNPFCSLVDFFIAVDRGMHYSSCDSAGAYPCCIT
jgi:hypothetical protein